jgi:hypothetical protein
MESLIQENLVSNPLTLMEYHKDPRAVTKAKFNGLTFWERTQLQDQLQINNTTRMRTTEKQLHLENAYDSMSQATLNALMNEKMPRSSGALLKKSNNSYTEDLTKYNPNAPNTNSIAQIQKIQTGETNNPTPSLVAPGTVKMIAGEPVKAITHESKDEEPEETVVKKKKQTKAVSEEGKALWSALSDKQKEAYARDYLLRGDDIKHKKAKKQAEILGVDIHLLQAIKNLAKQIPLKDTKEAIKKHRPKEKAKQHKPAHKGKRATSAK